jgi:hypothetical protein
MADAPVMHVRHQARQLFNRAEDDRSTIRAGKATQVRCKVREINGIENLFGELIPFVGKSVASPVKQGQRARSG